MTSFTILGVTEIWYSFRLVLEGKAGKDIPESSRLEFSEKFLANNFDLSDAEDNTSGPLNRGGIADFLWAKFLRNGRFFCFISIWKFGTFKKPFATITSLSELYFRFRGLILLVEAQAAEKHRNEWGLTWYLRLRIYKSIPSWTLSQNSLAAEALSLKILPWNIPQMITKNVPISSRIVRSYTMKWGIPFRVCWKVSGKWDKNMIWIPQWKESHCRANASIRRKKEIQKSRILRVTIRDPSRKVNHPINIISNIKVITEFTRSICSTEKVSQSLTWTLKSP